MEDLQFLKRGNVPGYIGYTASKWLLILLLIGKVGVFLFEEQRNRHGA